MLTQSDLLKQKQESWLVTLQAGEGFFNRWHAVGLHAADVADLICFGITFLKNLDLHVERVSDLVIVPIREQANVVTAGEGVWSSFRFVDWVTQQSVWLIFAETWQPEVIVLAVLQLRNDLDAVSVEEPSQCTTQASSVLSL